MPNMPCFSSGSPAHFPRQGCHKTRCFGQAARGLLHRKDGLH
ncbi:hypothetical protein E2320_007809 [Naja naja]|nr:hypothetical protein E2320_007809 [Naja naja]